MTVQPPPPTTPFEPVRPPLSPATVDALFGGPAAPHHTPAAVATCRSCGSYPAVEATIRSHQGFVFLMRTCSVKGMFCRDCGLATQRDASADTLWRGWWGVASLVVTPMVLLANLVPRARFRALPPPVSGGPGQPLDPGIPLRRRPAIVGLVVPLVLLVVLISAIVAGGSHGEVETGLREGMCVSVTGPSGDIAATVIPCDQADATTRRVTRVYEFSGGASAACPRGSAPLFVDYDAHGGLACVDGGPWGGSSAPQTPDAPSRAPTA